jgi:hypothetical protein
MDERAEIGECLRIVEYVLQVQGKRLVIPFIDG